MPNKLSKLTPGKGYSELVKKIRVEFSTLEALFRQLSAKCYWKVGEYIHKHILENKGRADYGKYIYDLLADDLGREKSTLQRTVQFFLAYPTIIGTCQQLSWSHYRKLITVQDKDERKKLEAKIIQKGWNVEKLQEYLNTKRSLEAQKGGGQPIPKLEFTRGKLWTYGVVESEAADSGFLLDLGFKVRKDFPEAEELKISKGDCVQVEPEKKGSFTKVSAKREEIFTYKAEIEKIVDGDTLIVLIDLGFDLFIQQKLRLRGIDCPEMDTDEGAQAKKFVEARLNKCDFIIVKTYKDSSDKYDRYLADIFYLKDEDDVNVVLEQGKFLNQELLDSGLARIFV
jgi:endonuclease YncB( thermonuclease family)